MTSVETDATGACFAKVGNWDNYTESFVCPLNEPDAKDIKIPAECSLTVGKKASGYLSRDENGDTSGSHVVFY